MTGTVPAASALLICPTFSSGAVNTTEIGCSLTMVTMPGLVCRMDDVAGIDQAGSRSCR